MKKYVLDACALIALLNREDGGESVREIIEQAKIGSSEVYMSIVNLFEVYYGMLRIYDEEVAESLILMVEASPIKVIATITREVLKEAGRLKVAYKMSVADSIAVAEASVSNGILVTSDHHELDAVEASENTKFYWFR